MAPRKYRMHDGQKGVALAVRVTPRASRNEITEILEDGTIKIHIKASPVDNAANRQLVKFLADVLDVPASHIEIVAGQTGRDKLIAVVDVRADEVQDRLMAHMG